mgnify:CR=1 FL=1
MSKFKKRFAIGIDQAKTNTGITIIEVGKQKPVYQTTIQIDETIKTQAEILYCISRDVENVIIKQLYQKTCDVSVWPALVVTREDHRFKQFGFGSQLHEVAGHLDHIFIDRGMKVN